MSTPSQRHVIPLQGRPYENDQVGDKQNKTILCDSVIFS